MLDQYLLALPGHLGGRLEVAHVLFEALIAHLMRYIDLRLTGFQKTLLVDDLIRVVRPYSSLMIDTAGILNVKFPLALCLLKFTLLSHLLLRLGHLGFQGLWYHDDILQRFGRVGTHFGLLLVKNVHSFLNLITRLRKELASG